MQAFSDPSQRVDPQLIPHVHLVSAYRFPLSLAIHQEKAAQWLLAAPKVARAEAPFHWTYLDRPVDGTVLLIWQPPNTHEFASDGYIWSPGEQGYSIQVGEYMLEVFQAKAGFSPGDPVATHQRLRYRIGVVRGANPSNMPDPNLWLIHYKPADPECRIPSHLIPIDHRIDSIMKTRGYLHTQGQLERKDFMLHDRNNWPEIPFPRGPTRQQQIYPGSMPPRMAVPPPMAYQQPQTKRSRPNPPSGAAVGPNSAAAVDDDEEDTTRGDFFDLTTPSDISTNRYVQNHEWMEEVLSSPYPVNRIVPSDLGLGVKGELGRLTDGIFHAPLDPLKEKASLTYVGRLQPSKAAEFRSKAEEHIAQTNKDIEKMRAKHAKRLAKFKKGSVLIEAEKELRTAVDDPSDTGPEYWRLEGRTEEENSEDSKSPFQVTFSKVDDILAKVEATLGLHAQAVRDIRRIQDGGYEEPAALPTPEPYQSNGSADIDMGNTAAGLLDQYGQAGGISAQNTPGSYPTPGHLHHSAAHTPNLHIPSPSVQGGTPQPRTHTPSAIEGNDTEMSDGGQQFQAAGPAPTNASGNDSGDWVVVPPGGVSPLGVTPSQQSPAHNASTPAALPSASALAPPTAQHQQHEQQQHEQQPEPQHEQQHEQQQQQQQQADTPVFQAPNDDDFNDLEDLDTAGEALASYTGGDELDGGDLEGGLGEESAFGEAFHGMDTPGADDL